MMHPPLNRRNFVKLMGLGTVGLAACTSTDASMPVPQRDLYIGTYTDGESRGIYRYRLNTDTGALGSGALLAEADNPSFLTFNADGSHLYAVNELTLYEGHPSGAVSAYAVDESSGGLTFLNQQSSRGGAPCHLSMDASGKWVLVANYVGGNVAVLPVASDGRLGEATAVLQHEGQGGHPRQEGPHAHAITPDPSGAFAFVADLGLDQIYAYRLDTDAGQLKPHRSVSLAPGAGPRHFAFHPNGRQAYVINELNSTLTVLDYTPEEGRLAAVQTVPTIPGDYTGENYCADVHLTPDGRFLYGSNRGHDSIAVFAVEAQTGRVTPRGHTSTEGNWPRNFVIDPSGTFLLVANQRSSTVVTLRINPETGALLSTGQITGVPAPVCLKFRPRPTA